MHYKHEGAKSMAHFITRLQTEQTIVIFGPDCLIDARVKAGLDPVLPESEPTNPQPPAQPPLRARLHAPGLPEHGPPARTGDRERGAA